MKKILDLITDEVTKAFTECGYDAKYAKVTLSNRPDLCEYQCNGAMAAAKEYKKAPVTQMHITDHIVSHKFANTFHALTDDRRTQMSYMERFCNVWSAIVDHVGLWRFCLFTSKTSFIFLHFYMLTVGAGEVICCCILGSVLLNALAKMRNVIFKNE